MARALNIRSPLIGSWRASKDRSPTRIYTLILALVHTSLWEYGRETIPQDKEKGKLILWRLYTSPFVVLGIARKKENLQCPFVYSFLGSLFRVHNFQFRKHIDKFFIGRNLHCSCQNCIKNLIAFIPDSRTPRAERFSALHQTWLHLC